MDNLKDEITRNLPCIDCVTFAVCKPRYFSVYNEGTPNYLGICREELFKVCPIIKDWILNCDRTFETILRCDTFHEFYTEKKVPEY